MYIFSKRASDGAVVFETVTDGTPVPAGSWGATEADLGGMQPYVWVQDKVWDDALGRPRVTNQTEQLEQARTAKRKELEERFTVEWSKYFQDPVFAVVAYSELKADPRTVAVTAAKNNLINKETALSDLGRNGRPALTFDNIAGIVW